MRRKKSAVGENGGDVEYKRDESDVHDDDEFNSVGILA